MQVVHFRGARTPWFSDSANCAPKLQNFTFPIIAVNCITVTSQQNSCEPWWKCGGSVGTRRIQSCTNKSLSTNLQSELTTLNHRRHKSVAFSSGALHWCLRVLLSAQFSSVHYFLVKSILRDHGFHRNNHNVITLKLNMTSMLNSAAIFRCVHLLC